MIKNFRTASCPLCARPFPGTIESTLTQSCSCPAAALKSEIEEVSPAHGEQGNQCLSIGTLINNRFKILAEVEKSRFWTIYCVLDKSTNLLCEMRALAPGHVHEGLDLSRQLVATALEGIRLTHPHIASVYEVGSDQGVPFYMIMDYVPGYSLRSLLQAQKYLLPSRAIGIFLQIAEALSCAHLEGLRHGQLTPANILLTETQDGSAIVKLVNFGVDELVTTAALNSAAKFANSREFASRVSYLSPEQCKSDDWCESSDIYACGCIMYETLSGRPPFACKNAVQTIMGHLRDPVPRLANPPKQYPGLETIIDKCLNKNRHSRYASATDLQLELERCLNRRPIRKSPLANSCISKLVWPGQRL